MNLSEAHEISGRGPVAGEHLHAGFVGKELLVRLESGDAKVDIRLNEDLTIERVRRVPARGAEEAGGAGQREQQGDCRPANGTQSRVMSACHVPGRSEVMRWYPCVAAEDPPKDVEAHEETL